MQLISNGWDLENLGLFSARRYKFVCTGKDQIVTLKLGTMEKNKNGKTLYFYDCDGYCKRLLGNTYSIPVVEHLLSSLRDVFLHKRYDNAVYRFRWE